MLMIMTSPDAVLKNGSPDSTLVSALKAIAATGNPVALISNHAKPGWVDSVFASSKVQFLKQIGRQSGEVVSHNAKNFKLKAYDTLVLAAKDEDVRMGKNGGAVLIAAGWSQEKQIQTLGIRVSNASELKDVIGLTEKWQGHWWYSADGANYKVRALADLSQYNKTVDQAEFAGKLQATVKQGGPRLTALLTVTARSLLMDGIGTQKDLLWGVYPSSESDNQDHEVLSDFSHRLRTTVSRVRYCKPGEPLFIRHTPAIKRSLGGQDRLDPSNQVATLHLNPTYQGGALQGRHVVLIDDCTTYGASFGVGAAFLKRAGAASVTGVALGKFGNQLREFDITLTGNPFAAIKPSQMKLNGLVPMGGATSGTTQQILLNLIP
jgi:phosphoribosylpyrophosphate synthetase